MRLTLRPHHLLCRLGFQGYGYSPEFIHEMKRTVKLIASGRVQNIIIRPGFDDICLSCPHHEYECSSRHLGPRGTAAAEFDRRTLRTLKLKPGYRYSLSEINERIAALPPEEFSRICAGCEWQALGTCAQGHLALREQYFTSSSRRTRRKRTSDLG